jgi:hypothetical protein
MSTFQTPSTTYHASATPSNAFKVFTEEVTQFFKAILSPNALIGEVEQMRALQVEAARIESTDAVRAAALRRRASLIGLR